jgi:hypothetical protein
MKTGHGRAEQSVISPATVAKSIVWHEQPPRIAKG